MRGKAPTCLCQTEFSVIIYSKYQRAKSLPKCVTVSIGEIQWAADIQNHFESVGSNNYIVTQNLILLLYKNLCLAIHLGASFPFQRSSLCRVISSILINGFVGKRITTKHHTPQHPPPRPKCLEVIWSSCNSCCPTFSGYIIYISGIWSFVIQSKILQGHRCGN